MIWRDDDAPYKTKPEDFYQVHELLAEAEQTHTIAVICRSLHLYPWFTNYVNSRKNEFDIQYHCFDHIDHTQISEADLREQFLLGTSTFQLIFGKRPSVWFPTWNKSNQLSEQIASEYGMKTSKDKISLSYFIKHGGNFDPNTVINFHHWYEPEREQLAEALKLLK